MHSPPQRKRPGTAGQQPEAQHVCDVSPENTTIPHGVRCFLALSAAAKDPRLQRSDVGCLAVILDHYNASQGSAWPGITRIAGLVGAHRATAMRSVHRLEASGYVRVSRTNGRPNRYVPDLPTSRTHATGSTVATGSTHAVEPVAPVRPDPSHACDPNLPIEHTQGTSDSGRASATANPSGAKSRRKSPSITLRSWIDSLPEGERTVPADDPVFAYGHQIGLPPEFLKLAWEWFKGRYLGDQASKRYRDWRATFRNSVKGNWGKLWWLNGDDYELTTVGRQLQRELEARP